MRYQEQCALDEFGSKLMEKILAYAGEVVILENQQHLLLKLHSVFWKQWCHYQAEASREALKNPSNDNFKKCLCMINGKIIRQEKFGGVATFPLYQDELDLLKLVATINWSSING